MPNYDYYCTECDEEFVKLAKYSETEGVECENCKKTTTKRIYTSFPGITRVSYTDGTRREGFAELKAEAKLRDAANETRPGSEEYKQINKELEQRAKVNKKK